MTPALTCNELRPLLGGYVLEALEPDEAEAVRAHLPGCPRVRRRARLAGRAAAAARPRRAGLAPGRAARARHRGGAARPRRPRVATGRRRARAKRRRLPRIAWTRPRVAIASAADRRRRGGDGDRDGDPRRRSPPRRAATSWRCTRARRRRRRRPRIALYRVHGGTGVHLWAKGLAAGLEAGLRDAVREREVDASAGTFRADAQGRVERAAHDRGTGRGIRPRQRRH